MGPVSRIDIYLARQFSFLPVPVVVSGAKHGEFSSSRDLLTYEETFLHFIERAPLESR